MDSVLLLDVLEIGKKICEEVNRNVYLADRVRKPKRDNPKIIFKSEKEFQIAIIFANPCWKVCQISKTIANPNKNIGSTNKFFTNTKIVCNPKIDVKSRKIF